MVKVKKGDFIELEYTGKLISGKIFDTNIGAVGEKNQIPKKEYSPLLVCVGEKFVIKGLDKNLEGCEEEKPYTFEIPSEAAYGKKNPKLVRVVSKALFTKQKMNPHPGMQINAEGMAGIIRSVSGGRVTVDFNHPLAGRDLIFDIKIIKIIKSAKEKADGLLKSFMGLPADRYKIELNGDKLNIETDFPIPDNMLNFIKEKISKLVPEIKSIEFSTKKKEPTTSE
jgi:FKBP-type peptidyl-prolyl cis-trans isomerase 2